MSEKKVDLFFFSFNIIAIWNTSGLTKIFSSAIVLVMNLKVGTQSIPSDYKEKNYYQMVLTKTLFKKLKTRL